jgi:hypothetical protein
MSVLFSAPLSKFLYKEIWSGALRIGAGFNRVSGSGSRKGKMTLKNRKKLRNFML